MIPGSLAALDSTLPPTPLKDLLAADGASVYVLSVDDELVRAVQEAGGDQYPVRTLDEWPELVDAVGSGRSKIVLLDADAVPIRLEHALAELQEAAGTLVVLVAARREEAQSMMGLLSERRIHRLLIKPAALGITRLLLESAVSRYLQLREAPDAAPATPGRDRHRRARKPLPGKWPAWLVATALISLLLGALLVGGLTRLGGLDNPLLPDPRQAAVGASADGQARVDESGAAGGVSTDVPAAAGVSTDAPATVPPDADARSVSAVDPAGQAGDPAAELLRLAELAAAEGRSSRPAGDSALDYYAAVVADDPAHPAASGALAELIDGLFSEAEAALLEGALDDAAAALDDIRRVQPSSGRLAFLDTQLERARATPTADAVGGAGGAADAATAASSAASSAQNPAVASELESLVTVARNRIQQDLLLQPQGDSARDYLERAAALDGGSAAVAALRAQLAAAVAATARLALDLGNLEQAARYAEEAANIGGDPEALALLDLDLNAARATLDLERQSQTLAAGSARLRQGQLIEPDADGALHHLAALRRENPNFPGLAAPWRELTDRLAADARLSIGGQNWQEAERVIAALEESGAAPELAQTLAFEWRQAQYLAAPAPAGTLQLLEAVPPAYPESALRTQTEGWVDLGFIVDAEGRPRAIEVLGSQPGTRFVEAALDAVRQHRYVPFELDGRRYERRLELRVRFTLN